MKRLAVFVLAAALPLGSAYAAVNVNTADVAQLQTLKGIDAVKAQAIVDYRAKHGPLQSLRDLDKVPGIGKSTVLSIRKDVTFSGPDAGVEPMKKDNRAADRTDARTQRPDPNRFGKTAPGG